MWIWYICLRSTMVEESWRLLNWRCQHVGKASSPVHFPPQNPWIRYNTRNTDSKVVSCLFLLIHSSCQWTTPLHSYANHYAIKPISISSAPLLVFSLFALIVSVFVRWGDGEDISTKVIAFPVSEREKERESLVGFWNLSARFLLTQVRALSVSYVNAPNRRLHERE